MASPGGLADAGVAPRDGRAPMASAPARARASVSVTPRTEGGILGLVGRTKKERGRRKTLVSAFSRVHRGLVFGAKRLCPEHSKRVVLALPRRMQWLFPSA